ncbi:hypothetical protein ABN214_15880 [Proteus terrae]|uniref:hypothetical protein n=1 Tax=Proteus terrae TaxID=1574161 RepID=UPI0032DAE746
MLNKQKDIVSFTNLLRNLKHGRAITQRQGIKLALGYNLSSGVRRNLIRKLNRVIRHKGSAIDNQIFGIMRAGNQMPIFASDFDGDVLPGRFEDPTLTLSKSIAGSNITPTDSIPEYIRINVMQTEIEKLDELPEVVDGRDAVVVGGVLYRRVGDGWKVIDKQEWSPDAYYFQ